MAELAVHLPELHAGQLRIRSHPAKRKVLILGRRWGKTTFVATEAVERLLVGGGTIYAAPKAEQTDAFWEILTRQHGPPGRRRPGYLEEVIEAGLIYKNETRRLLRGEANGWGQISARTAYDSSTLRSGAADLLLLDEWPLMHPSAWESVGAPMLLDSGGDAYFVGTPHRKNHGYSYFMRGLQDDGGRWASFTGPSHENPHLSQEALDELASDMTEDMIQQEIYAKFLDNEGAVFHNIAAGLWPGGETPEDHKDHYLVAGLDWGKVGDYSACSIVCADCRREVELVRYRGEEYRMQRQRLGIRWDAWGVKRIVAESNSMGEPNIEMIRQDGYYVEPFAMSPASKPPLIEGMVLSLERAEYRWLDAPIAKAELEAYERKVSKVTGHTSYSAPAGVHDDTVIARCLSRLAAARPAPTVRSLFDD